MSENDISFLIHISLMSYDEHLFICLKAIFYFLSKKEYILMYFKLEIF